ncbi:MULTISPECIES: nitrate reductase [Pandoraea]|uniref:nitrate reductase n=1 Tax=Pandoraea TaxID=93217 RepID=UPI001F5D7F8A|nr:MULTISPECIES: nitrate reductase [Pandoraea]MCI3205210.1 nitrate reductase [Pandoraea sp. LA3]MDN4583238.1 nitrate reductase [Pandoraea capi]
MTTITQTTCCYCGVGCGMLVESDGERIVGVQGDPAHPANYGRLCSKGMTLPLTAQSLAGRVLMPEMRTSREAERAPATWDTALATVASRFADVIDRHGPDAVAFYVSGQLLTEDYYVFNKLAKGLVRTNNIDTNSRLCMSSAVSAYKMALGADGPPTCYDDLEAARTVIFAGSNMAYAHPVLFRRLEAAKAADPSIRWIVVDPRRTDTAALADLHLPIVPGTDVALFHGMLHHLIWEGRIDRRYIDAHTDGFDALKQTLRAYPPQLVADICGIEESALRQAADWFGESPAALSLYCMGLNQSSHGTEKNLALIHLHLATGQIGRPGAGPFSLTGQPNAMGGREVGGLATMLAAHRDIGNAAHRAEVEQLWGVQGLSDKPGLPAVEMFDAVRDGRIKAIWIACTNPVHSMPDSARVREALATAEFVVVQEAFHQTDTVPYADVLLPAASWGEKAGTVTNSERRISRVRAAVPAPGDARPDWWIASEVARRLAVKLGVPSEPFAFSSIETIFDEHRALTVGRDLDIGGIDYALLAARGPQQWPFPAGAAHGAARRYEDGVFATADGRAKFHAFEYRPVAEPINARHPLRLITGRLRDQWHGMSRTGRVGQLFEHAPEPALTMHPADAARRSLRAGDFVRLSSRRGERVLLLTVSDDVASGSVFVPMHWSGQFLGGGGVNDTTTGAVDKYSKQPELKHAAVRVDPLTLPWRVAAVRRGDALQLHAAVQPLLAQRRFATVRLEGDDRIVVSAADDRPDAEWLERLHTALGLPRDESLLEYRDARRAMTKRVAWRGTLIDGVLVAGSEADVAGSTSLLARVRETSPWTRARHAVFVADSGPTAPRDRTVCQCKSVTASSIGAAIEAGADVAQLKAKLGCGTVCGSCVPELQRMCAASSGATPKVSVPSVAASAA